MSANNELATMADVLKSLMLRNPANAEAFSKTPANLDLTEFMKSCETRGDAFSGMLVQGGWNLLKYISTKRPEVSLPDSAAGMTVENLFKYLATVRTTDIQLENREKQFEIWGPVATAFISLLLSGLGQKEPQIIVVNAPTAPASPQGGGSNFSMDMAPGPGGMNRRALNLTQLLRG